ncbi:hypothetical protein HF670_13370 [Acidithiobacillus thiooxidans]|jgi:predicted tellurium resistance membrane protein TerC|uniref:hypothetical protein n=1 Tax=Acidithiobacillus thiooxidans TaxID=930 RepID=UPI001C07EC88|nr:hypothetical protein [Acidithiobacillus thiooxidans]MBU2840513.1 hypothetical protein [Acidithiobacillus thiooxidans]
MSTRNILMIISLVAGMVTEPFMITPIMRSRPPIGWTSLALISVGGAVAVFIVLGFQGLIGNQQNLRLWLNYFALIAIYFFGVGLVAFILGLIKLSIQPHSVFFIMVASGLALGLYITKLTC